MMLTKHLKTLVFALLALAAAWASPARAQGTIPLALVQQFDSSGSPLAGCLLYSYVAGTVATPQNVYSDYGLTQPLPNPTSCDQSGRVPMLWYANGLIHVRLTDSNGGPQVDTTLQVLGPSGGGGGGGTTVDPTTILATGDVKPRYGTGALSGFVRGNGLTIGNATSGATERANADTQNLFVYLYQTDPNLVVSGGRTGNALTDYNSGKTIALPDYRGTNLAGLADMGNTPTTVLTSTYFGTSPTTLGAFGGVQDYAIAQANLPNVSPTFTGTAGTVTVSSVGIGTNVLNFGASGSGAFFVQSNGSSNPASGTFTPAGTISALGSGTPMALLPPMRLLTIYIKL